jgi:phosphoribosylaminoimidazolecarboxamide formyltransferase / IMP cyclohydrolase
MTHKQRVLLSVYDKTGLVEFSRALAQLGWELVASGGTARTLAENGLPVRDVSAITGYPEMLGGRVKTLHPAVHGGILARDLPEDAQDLAANEIKPISMVVCNLYPFSQTIAQPDVTLAEAIEQIDIGGVALLRAAAKNFARVAVVSNPGEYTAVIQELQTDGHISPATRQRLAVQAFQHTRDYDTAIAAYLADLTPTNQDTTATPLPATLNLTLHQTQALRYGENPHQNAGLYSPNPTPAPLGGQLLQGKELSYNNLLDLDAAWRTAESFRAPTVAIVKHLSPCGIACAATPAEAFPAALASDPVSAFGGVIAVNRVVDEAFTAQIQAADLFVEAVVAPAFTPEAQAYFARKKKNCRLVALGESYAPAGGLEIRTIRGGFLVQDLDVGDPATATWTVVSARQPSEAEMEALRFAWQAVSHVKSNAIVLAKGERTLGVGCGLPSRIDAVALAAQKAGDEVVGAVMASDAFFPFSDGIELAAQHGVTAVVQPGGSVRDDLVIEAVNKLGMAMIFTGTRHFRH